MEPKDLKDEEFRVYEFASGKQYTITNPVTLYVGATTHRVVDASGVVHCVAFPGPSGDTVLRWKPRDPSTPVQF